MRICFDLDNTLCYGTPYEEARPIPGRDKILKRLREEGHTVIIYTARFMNTCNFNTGEVVRKIGKLTLDQLEDWGFEYDEIYFGKPSADLYIDDKALHVSGINNIMNIINVIEAKKNKIQCDLNNRCDKINKLIEKMDCL